MRAPTFAALLPLALVLGCEPGVPATDFRHELPSRADWLTRIHAPGRTQKGGTRTVMGAAARLLIDGEPGKYELSAVLSTTACAGPDGQDAVMDVRVEDFSVAKWTVSPGPAAPFRVGLTLDTKPQRVDVFFTNDFATSDCDRNVTVHEIVVASMSPSP